jgi:hypothetical protein
MFSKKSIKKIVFKKNQFKKSGLLNINLKILSLDNKFEK